MANTWRNHVCRFVTKNTENSNGDSIYTVNSGGLYRDALINLQASRNAVDRVMNYHTNRSICYTSVQDDVWKVIDASVDHKAEVVSVNGNDIVIKAGQLSVKFCRIPRLNDCVLDFCNDAGTPKEDIHPGHRVFKFLGAPIPGEFWKRKPFEERLKAFREAIISSELLSPAKSKAFADLARQGQGAVTPEQQAEAFNNRLEEFRKAIIASGRVKFAR